MPPKQDAIVAIVENSIDEFVDLFKQEPNRFFTENDLVCCFHRHLHNSLESIDSSTARDIAGSSQNLIHCEFPTPFRCDMKNTDFERKMDDDRTDSGKKKYKRGHYDIVVLNPDFIGRHSYSQIKCQDYEDYRRDVALNLLESGPLVLFGIELVFSRDPIPMSDRPDRERAARAFVKELEQDTKKLAASVLEPGFMKQSAMLAFTRGTTREVNDLIRRLVRDLFPCERSVRFFDAYVVARS